VLPWSSLNLSKPPTVKSGKIITSP
jgi:hypothetical protein